MDKRYIGLEHIPNDKYINLETNNVLIPCMQKRTGQKGLYDVLYNKFYTHDEIRDALYQAEQLKSVNEELRSDNSMLLARGDADAFVISNLNFKIQKLQQCLDEIEELFKQIRVRDDASTSLVIEIYEKIKQAKEVKE